MQKKILVPSLLILAANILGLSAAASYVATALGRPPTPPLFTAFDFAIFSPADFLIWFWRWYSAAPAVFDTGLLIYLVGLFAGVGLAVVYRTSLRRSTAFGSARWASRKDYADLIQENVSGVVLGRKGGHILAHAGPEHIALIAPTRSGKGVGVIIPTLTVWRGSAIVNDLKGENYDVTAAHREKRLKQKIYRFAPAEMPGQNPHLCRLNPLAAVRPGENSVKDAQMVADILVDPHGTGLEDHWQKTSHALLTGVILHLKATSDGQATLAGLASWLSRPDIWATIQNEMLASPHPVAAQAAAEILAKDERERSGVLSTAASYLSLYRDPIVAANTSANDLDFADLLHAPQPATLYIIIPPAHLSRLRPLLRLIVNIALRRLTETPQKPRRQLLFLLDEFPALGKLEFFQSALGFTAGYGVKTLIVAQSMNQIYHVYGQRSSVLDNCHVQVYYAPNPNDAETAKHISEALGRQTIRVNSQTYSGFGPLARQSLSESETGRPLLDPAEVRALDREKEIILIANRPPIMAEKIRYFDDPFFRKFYQKRRK
ncbi:type IV secretory system conjugative DNA transfer family protein [Sporolituus thermophilus]|uniref:Type IV secretion system protein VirD4 n=1 Tax=Sporolituus thermophilus DSM 23256 TaxID=1123285 RepID=A0A1G7MHJ9_9FIRM|nr:type IV secretory system conjugative DNA transfer family protein [Sporolituus thermophilus]SDF61282.1 type IV secretion system protein VirD4 [Sporolituus thermophilus DSM 23256]